MDVTGAISATTSITGASLSIDNITIDGNTISSTNTDGNITIDPNGTGTIELAADTNVAGSITVSKASGAGFKVDTTTPTYPWADLEGTIAVRGTGGVDPTFAVYIGGIRQFEYGVNDESFVEFHLPHDYAPGTDLYLHFHWSHNSASVTSGTVTWGAEVSYAKGHNQAPFIAPVTRTVAEAAPTTQYQHMITETQISISGGSVTQIDTDDIEPDGLILARLYLSANTMDASEKPFLHRVDMHYQSTGIGTKNKSPGFYT
jgi:hypothetical protein